MKSWALTAFAALALTASHGVHAAPKGRSLSAMSRILGLAKNHPKTSILLGVLGALSAVGYAKHGNALPGKVFSFVKRHPKKILFLGITGLFIAALALAEIRYQKRYQKRKAAQAKGCTIKAIERLLEVEDYPESFKKLSPALRTLKDAVEALKDFDPMIPKGFDPPEPSIVCATERLSNYVGKDSDAVKICFELDWVADQLNSEPERKALESEIRGLTTALKDVLKEEFPRAAQELAQALKRKDTLKSLVEPFRAFADTVQREYLNSWKRSSLMSAISYLNRAAKAKKARKTLEYSKWAISDLGRIEVEQLKNGANTLKKAIKGSMTKQLPQAVQEVAQALENNNSLKTLAGPFRAFVNAVQNIKSLGAHKGNHPYQKMNKIKVLIEQLSDAAKGKHQWRTIQDLNCAIEDLSCVTDTPLFIPAYTLKAAAEKAKKEIEGKIPAKKRFPSLFFRYNAAITL